MIRSRRYRLGTAMLATTTAWLVLVLAPGAGAHDPQLGVDPQVVDETAVPGASFDVAKVVHTSEVPPNPDVVFLADTTGSMGPAIANLQAGVAGIMTDVTTAEPTAQFAAAEYEDFDCLDSAFGFNLNQPITSDQTAIQTAVNTWAAIGNEGCDIPEAQVFALHELATNPALGFRMDSTRIVAWFGDASGHDPSNGIGLAQAIAALQAAGIRVVAVNTPTPFGDGLDATGQATAITTATGGVFLDNVAAGQVSQAILDGIQAIEVTVTPQVAACDPSLTVTFDPASRTVESGEDASFTETIQVDAGAPQGQDITCTVEWLVDGQLPGPEFVQEITIHVADVTPPEAACTETTNPSGKRVPPAGSTTLPGAKGGQNEDGFYELTAEDAVDPDPEIFLVDTGSGTVFGPFASGTRIKYTQAPGATPSQKKMGSDGDAVLWHIKGTGDAEIFAVDDAGNESDRVSCLVPPPPK